MRIKVVIKNTNNNEVKIINSDTGEPMKNITGFNISYSVGESPKLTLDFCDFDIDVEVEDSVNEIYGKSPIEDIINDMIKNIDFQKEINLMCEERAKNENISN